MSKRALATWAFVAVTATAMAALPDHRGKIFVAAAAVVYLRFFAWVLRSVRQDNRNDKPIR